jgi:hypothetical protein
VTIHPEIRVSLTVSRCRPDAPTGTDITVIAENGMTSRPILASVVQLPCPYGRTMPAEVDAVAIVTGTVAAKGKELAFVTTASTV